MLLHAFVAEHTVVLSVLAFSLTSIWFLNRHNQLHRTIATSASGLVALNYLHWRFFETVLPEVTNELTTETAWISVVFFVELLMFFELVLFLIIMSKHNNRHRQIRPELTSYPSVDVFIPTYNEPIDVLEKTILGARNIDYPNFNVWVLDDGNRDWLKDYCDSKNVGYIRRNNNDHAKAGNMNNALDKTSGDFVAVFDADFVPNRNFIKKTLPYFIEDDTIGIVQTPQTFFNKDPIQSNLNLHTQIPDEQRLFFEEIAPARDGWGAAFCCGSCSILRRKHLEDIGGFPTESITEDLLTTLEMLSRGHKTIYHNETLSRGLASESVEGYFVQRERWCQGGIQCMYLKNGPLRMKRLGALQRLMFLPYGWVIQPITRLFVLIVPLVYLLAGLAPISLIDYNDIVEKFIPMLIMFFFVNIWLTGKKYLPILNTATGLFSTFRLLPVTVQSLIKPFGRPFKVTPKGSNNEGNGVDTVTLCVSFLLFSLTLIGILINFKPEWSVVSSTEFFPYALFWATLNLIYLFLCMLMSFDFKTKRKEERFSVGDHVVSVGDCNYALKDVSVSGFSCEKVQGVEKGDIVDCVLFAGDAKKELQLTAQIVTSGYFTSAKLNFSKSSERDRLIEILFSGEFDNSVKHYSSGRSVLRGLWNRICKSMSN